MKRLVQCCLTAAWVLLAGEGSLEEAGFALGFNRWKGFIEKQGAGGGEFR